MIAPQGLPREFTLPHILSGLSADTPILAGFSGGADSTALLNMLALYGKLHGAPIYAAHINHGIRGEEADRDEEFCRQTCAALGIELFVLRADVPAIAKESGDSIETAARQVRYDFFDSVMKDRGIPLLATAHNADDNLETMLFNLVRGSSLSGIKGIPEARSCSYGTVIRPILSMSKADILSFCEANSLSYVTDSTNTDTDYTRNKIRAEIIPLLCEINGGAIRNSARLASALRADALCLDSMADMFSEGLCENFSVEAEKLCGSPEAIANRALVSMYRDISGGESLEYSHIQALRELAKKAVPHSAVTLPHGFEGVIENGRLMLRKKQAPTATEPYRQELREGKNIISQINCEIVIVNSQNAKNIYKNSIPLSLDSAKIVGGLYARPRAEGDKIFMGGMRKSVKKLMCDKKIPIELRGRIPIICDSDGIVAIPLIGVRDSCRHKTNSPSTELFIYIN